MSSDNNYAINAAYVASWKQKNPKLADIESDGHYLKYKNEKIDISEIYMQDILMNPNIFHGINTMESQDLFHIIKIHVYSLVIKEKELEEKVRRYKDYEYSN